MPPNLRLAGLQNQCGTRAVWLNRIELLDRRRTFAGQELAQRSDRGRAKSIDGVSFRLNSSSISNSKRSARGPSVRRHRRNSSSCWPDGGPRPSPKSWPGAVPLHYAALRRRSTLAVGAVRFGECRNLRARMRRSTATWGLACPATARSVDPDRRQFLPKSPGNGRSCDRSSLARTDRCCTRRKTASLRSARP